jgi:dimethylsulfone monooxygenase
MPERVTAEPSRFAYWVPNVSGELVTSIIEQRTDRGDEYNKESAVRAERASFDYALSQLYYMAGYGAEYQLKARATNVALEITNPGGTREHDDAGHTRPPGGCPPGARHRRR